MTKILVNSQGKAYLTSNNKAIKATENAFILITSSSGTTLTCGTQIYTLGESEIKHAFSVPLGTYTCTASKTGLTTRTKAITVSDYTVYETSLRPSTIPEGYTELEYIRSTGDQYIDTLLIPNGNYKAILSMNVTDTNTGRATFGIDGDNTWGVYFGGSLLWDDYNDDKSVSIPSTYLGSLVITKDKGNTTFERPNTSAVTITRATSTITDTRTCYLFAKNGSSRAKGIFQCYSFKMWDDDVAVCNLVPCYRDSDNKVGMYDIVRSQFFSSATSSDFIAGPEI